MSLKWLLCEHLDSTEGIPASQNHGMVRVGRDFKAHLIPTTLPWQGHFPQDHAAPNQIQPGFEGKFLCVKIDLSTIRSRIGPQSLNTEKKIECLAEVKEPSVFGEAVSKKKKFHFNTILFQPIKFFSIKMKPAKS